MCRLCCNIGYLCNSFNSRLREEAWERYEDRAPKPTFYDDAAGQLTIPPYVGVFSIRQSDKYSLEQKLNSTKDFAGFIASGRLSVRGSSPLVVQKVSTKLSVRAAWKLNESILAAV